MKEIQLTQGYIALVDDEDFERVNQFKWCALVDKRKDGSIRNVYAQRKGIKVEGKCTYQYMHRFILGITENKVQGDHKDHNGVNNQRYNLRTSTNEQNSRNQRLSTANTSGSKGVYWSKRDKKWWAQICVYGKSIYLGCFTYKAEASKAYDAATLLYHKEFAFTNAMLAVA